MNAEYAEHTDAAQFINSLLRSVINSPEILNFTCLLYSKCRFWAKKKSAACGFYFWQEIKI